MSNMGWLWYICTMESYTVNGSIGWKHTDDTLAYEKVSQANTENFTSRVTEREGRRGEETVRQHSL